MLLTRLHMGLTAVAVAGLFAQSAAPPAFEVASVKRNPEGHGANTRSNESASGLNYIAVPLQWIIGRAYSVPHQQVFGPDWIESEGYDAITRVPAGTPRAQIGAMLQNLLAERFHLAVHRDTKDMQALVLGVAKGGPKLHASDQAAGGYQMKMNGPIRHMKTTTTMKAFAQMLSGILGQLAVDQTELSGVFEIAVDWTMNEDIPVPGETEDTIFKAVEAQLGLKLEQKKMPLEVLIVDHADKCRPGINQ